MYVIFSVWRTFILLHSLSRVINSRASDTFRNVNSFRIPYCLLHTYRSVSPIHHCGRSNYFRAVRLYHGHLQNQCLVGVTEGFPSLFGDLFAMLKLNTNRFPRSPRNNPHSTSPTKFWPMETYQNNALLCENGKQRSSFALRVINKFQRDKRGGNE